VTRQFRVYYATPEGMVTEVLAAPDIAAARRRARGRLEAGEITPPVGSASEQAVIVVLLPQGSEDSAQGGWPEIQPRLRTATQQRVDLG
jgi:hypothetical protein